MVADLWINKAAVSQRFDNRITYCDIFRTIIIIFGFQFAWKLGFARDYLAYNDEMFLAGLLMVKRQ